VDVDRLVGATVGLPPHLREQLTTADDLGRAARQVSEEVELQAREVEGLPVERGHPPVRVDGQAADLHEGAGARAGGRAAPEDGADARVELRGRIGLDHVVVGAGIEQPHDLRFVVPRRRDDHRHRGHATDHAEDVGPVEVRQTEVEHDDVGRPVDDRLERVGAAPLGAHGMPAVGERAGEGLPDALVVLDHEHGCHGVTLRRCHAAASRFRPG